jgi:hypothetical protein
MKSATILAIAMGSMPLVAQRPASEKDIKGVVSDTVTQTFQECKTLCVNNPSCIYSLYHDQCKECFQMDCGGHLIDTAGTSDHLLSKDGKWYYCNSTTMPKLPDAGCTNMTASGASTSPDQPAGSRKPGAGVPSKEISMGGLILAVVAAVFLGP